MYKKLVIIAREPTPYMIDLFNAFHTYAPYKIFVLFTTAKVWTSSHDFKEFPEQSYLHAVCSGKGILGTIYSIISVIKHSELFTKNTFVLFNGYGTIPYIAGIFSCFIFKKRFALWADHFDTRPPKRMPFLSNILKKSIIKFVIKNSKFICMSGKNNIDTAVKIGCKESKLINFPYVIDEKRFIKNISMDLAIVKEMLSKANGRIVFFFSGRLFKRKGLDLLITAIAEKNDIKNRIFLIVEGEGSLRKEYEAQCSNLELENTCEFVGFRQMGEHASLMAMSDVVVIPSIYEPWCLIVHEGMLLKKIVLSSDKVGAAIERIDNGCNGFLFQSQDGADLIKKIELILASISTSEGITDAAYTTAKQFSPERNVEKFTEKMIE